MCRTFGPSEEMKFLSWFWRTFLLFDLLSQCSGDYNGDSFDGSLEMSIDQVPCVRLYTNEGAIGCRTKDEVSIGAIYEIRDANDLNSIKNINVDFSILTSAQYFTHDLMEILSEHHPQGVIVYDDNWIPTENSGQYSTDMNTTQGSGTPQTEYSFNRKYAWNNYGNGIMYQDLPYPVVRASNSEIKRLQRLASENRDFGMSGNRVNVGEFKFYMGKEDITSGKCLSWEDSYGDRHPQCLPIGGLSVWGSAAILDTRPKMIVTTAIDSTAFFHDLAYGNNDAVASISTILLAMDAVGRYQGLANLDSQPVFFLANAEEWGYAGSRRFVRDISDGISCETEVSSSDSPSGMPFCTAPIYPSTLFEKIGEAGISGILAIDQVGKLQNGQLFLHALADSPDSFQTIIDASTGVDGVTVAASSLSSHIPPTPMTSFLQTFNDLKANGVVLSGYDSQFDDPLYHSRFDTSENIVVTDIIRSAEVVARSVISLCGGDTSQTPSVNNSWALEIVDCLSSDWSCPMMKQYVNSEKSNLGEYLGGTVYFDSGTLPPNYYTGVLEANSGGLPVIQHSYYVYGRYTEPWDKHDRVYMIPNYLEAFLRSSLAYHLNQDALSSSSKTDICVTSSDCKSNCTIFDYEFVKMECVLDTCVCPVSFYHLALDPGVEAEVRPNYFEIVDESAVAYTEPYWTNIGLKVYPKTSSTLSIATFAMGIVACGLSILGAILANGYLEKIKAL